MRRWEHMLRKLIKYYTVSKSSGRKNVGKYKYTITFKNGYSEES